MRWPVLGLAAAWWLCGCGGEWLAPAPLVQCGDLDEDACARRYLEAMTLDEKIAQMHGVGIAPVEGLYHTADNERLGIPGFRMVDGPRGVHAGHATAFPVGMARGATWDPALERRVGAAIAMEARAKGANVILAPTMNILRHPGWGRAQETYGEDTQHLATMAAAFVEGAQQHLVATAKHFAANSIEDTRFEVDVSIDERTLSEIYLRHFRQVVRQAGVGAVMSAYNQVNGSYCSENEHLLTDLLRGQWGFTGVVMSDWMLATRSTVGSLMAGLDIEMPAPVYYGEALAEAVRAGDAPVDAIDEAVLRILRTKLRFDIAAPPPYGEEVVASAEHRELAREVADRSITLLKNAGGALPLDAGAFVALVGSLAAVANMGDEGSSKVEPAAAVSPLQGLQERAASLLIVDRDTLDAADQAAVASADAAVVVVGLSADDEGENLGLSGGDRDDLSLPSAQVALIEQVSALNARTIVVLEGGAAILVEGWVDGVQGLLMAYYPGEQGGRALADVLYGDVSPSGRLPFTVPRSEAQLVPFDHTSTAVEYGYLHGYRYLDAQSEQPRYPFGFGLSYTTFTYGKLMLQGTPEDALASVEITNTGSVAGEEVAQLYVGYPGSSVERPVRELKGFARVRLAPGQTQRVELPIGDLSYYDGADWRLEDIGYRVCVGRSSSDLPLCGVL